MSLLHLLGERWICHVWNASCWISCGEDWPPCPTFCLTALRQVFLFLWWMMNRMLCQLLGGLLLSFLIVAFNSCSITLIKFPNWGLQGLFKDARKTLCMGASTLGTCWWVSREKAIIYPNVLAKIDHRFHPLVLTMSPRTCFCSSMHSRMDPVLIWRH